MRWPDGAVAGVRKRLMGSECTSEQKYSQWPERTEPGLPPKAWPASCHLGKCCPLLSGGGAGEQAV